MNPILLALAAAGLRSINDIVYRSGMRTSCDPYLTAFVNSLVGGLVILAVLGLPDLSPVTWDSAMLLIIANIFWALQVYFAILSFRTLDAAVTVLLDASRFVLLNLAGFLIFAEQISLTGTLGLLLVTFAVIYGSDLSQIRFQPGTLHRVFSVLSGTAAMILDKHLVSLVGLDLVVIAGFLLPALLYLIFGGKRVVTAAQDLRKAWVFLLVSSLLFAAVGYCLVAAFTIGDLSETITIYQSSTVLTFVLGIVLLRETQNIARRAVGSLLCTIGVAIFCLS